MRYARRALAEYGTVVRASSVYETAPMYDEDQPRFVNAALLLRSERPGEQLLRVLQQIEADYGRIREQARRYGPRAIDLDIVCGTYLTQPVVVASPELQIPHPRMHERAFVLVPLAEIVTQWRHPLRGETLESLRESAGEDDSLRVVYRPEEWA